MGFAKLLFMNLTSLFLSRPICKVIPEDSNWPSMSSWNHLNSTVGGNLIKTVPIGSPCFTGPNFAIEQCDIIKKNWTDTSIYLPNPSAMQDSIFANNSCNPFLGPDGQCINGEYPEYAVNVSSPSDVLKTIQFARVNNIRLIVKNTGHDYMGRSSGHGALSIWTHSQQGQEWFDNYRDPWSRYEGPAFRAQAGVMGFNLATEADRRGYYVVSGECPTVGYTGGYVQGAGHSILSGFKGLAADQVLSFEVITTTGQFINASSTENSDLFWALRGGGGGSFGVVWTVTAKAYKTIPFSVATFEFNQIDNGPDTFRKALDIYHHSTPKFTDQGAYVLALHTKGSTSVPALILPNQTLNELMIATKPLFDAFTAINLTFTKSLQHFPGYIAMIDGLPTFQSFPVNDAQLGGRLIPRSIWESEESLQGLLRVMRTITDTGITLVDVAMNPKLDPENDGNSAVFPQWRTTERLFVTQATFSPLDPKDKLQRDVEMLASFDAQLASLAPGMGAYLNEANPFTPNPKEDFYGVNYDQLLRVKDKYDPDQMLWGRISVGGDRWVVEGDGRLCPQ